MCYNGVVWLSKVCYNVFIADSVYYNMFCIADMLHFHSFQLLFIALLASVPLDISRQIHAVKREIIVRINMAKTFHD